jgi:3-oxoacyl-(acyl-carrier-protein) synthase
VSRGAARALRPIVAEAPPVITGVGPVSALGNGADVFFEALLAGKSGTRPLTRCPAPPRGCAVAAECDEPAPAAFDPRAPEARAVQLAIAAARLAAADAGLDPTDENRERIGVIVGTGVGNADVAEAAVVGARAGTRLAPGTAFRAFAHAAACEVASALDLCGPIATVTSGCNAGADAIGLAIDWIRLGRADAVVAGGVEAELNSTFLAAMTAARALAVRYNGRPGEASRPFDTDRDGNVPGEGAGFLVIESAAHAARRKARVRAALLGYASRAAGRRQPYDPFHPVHDPAPMLRALRAALADARLDVGDLAAISANGSSSVAYDLIEAEALASLLGPAVADVPVCSVKGALGQTGAVTPALQIIAAAMSVERGVLPPTANAGTIDSRVRLRVVRGAPLRRRLDAILCNAIGFGGYYYSAAIVGRPE